MTSEWILVPKDATLAMLEFREEAEEIASGVDTRLMRWARADCLSWLSDAISTSLSKAVETAKAEALDEALAAQPSTAEDPNEDSYQRGRFDGIIEYGRAIAALRSRGGGKS
jgi:hypothetical protein